MYNKQCLFLTSSCTEDRSPDCYCPTIVKKLDYFALKDQGDSMRDRHANRPWVMLLWCVRYQVICCNVHRSSGRTSILVRLRITLLRQMGWHWPTHQFSPLSTTSRAISNLSAISEAPKLPECELYGTSKAELASHVLAPFSELQLLTDSDPKLEMSNNNFQSFSNKLRRLEHTAVVASTRFTKYQWKHVGS